MSERNSHGWSDIPENENYTILAILNTFHKVGQLCVHIVWRINQNVAGGGGGGAGVGVEGRGVIRDFGCSW